MSSCILNSLPKSDIYSHLTGNWLILCETGSESGAPCSRKKKKASFFTSVLDQDTGKKTYFDPASITFSLVLVNLVNVLSFGFLCKKGIHTHAYIYLCIHIDWVYIIG